MQSNTFIGCQGRFLRSLCKVIWSAFRNIAKLSFGNVNARFPKNQTAILPHKCLASFMQGHFGEYMAILKGCLLAILIKGCPENQMAMLPWHFFAIFMQVCFGEFTATYLDGKKYMYWLPGKVFASFMQSHFESISQHCQVMFLQCLCNITQRAYENIAMLVFCKLYARSFRWVYGNIEGLPSSNVNLGLPKKNKWQCCHAIFLQSLCKFVLASLWQPTQIPRTTFIDCQGRFLHPLCKVI